MERVLGIDVAQAWLDVAVVPDGSHLRVGNDTAGWADLCAQVQAPPPTRIVLEASGGDEQGVAHASAAAGVTPVIANPAEPRSFARSRGRKTKTDRIDAQLLAEFGRERRPEPRPLPSAVVRAARALLARRRQVTTMLVMEKNRGKQASPGVQPSIAALQTALLDQRHALDANLAALVASDPTLQARGDQLRTVPGIGVLIATALAVEVPELDRLTATDLTSLLGIAPFACDSGQRHRQRRISGRRRWVRHLLDEGMLTTIRCDPTFAASSRQLREGTPTKPVKVARIACVRKLLGILIAMVRDGLTWPETEVGQGFHLPAAA